MYNENLYKVIVSEKRKKRSRMLSNRENKEDKLSPYMCETWPGAPYPSGQNLVYMSVCLYWSNTFTYSCYLGQKDPLYSNCSEYRFTDKGVSITPEPQCPSAK